MKKILATIMVLAMVIAVMPTTLVNAFAYGNTAEFDANYDYDSESTLWSMIAITRYKGTGGDVIIPDHRDYKYVSHSVCAIYYGAFENCTTLTSVTIPYTVSSIGSYAFKSCTNLRAAYFLGDAPTMGSGVFDNCAPGFKVYYISGKTGFTNPWCSYPTEPAGNVTITFDATGGTGGYSASKVKGAALSAPAVAKTGYIFAGWSPSVPSIVPSVDTTYTAQWVESNPTISFESSGGSAVAPITQGYNTSVSKPVDPVKEGYAFGGWFLDSGLTAPVQWPYTITASTTFYAKWNTAGSYDIIFDAKGGTGGISFTMTAGANLTAPIVFKTGYIFAGWSPEVPSTVPAASTTYSAQWTANTYTVNYNGNGSTAGSTASSSYTYDISAKLTANGFTKIGNTFLGWSADSGATSATYTNGQSVINLSSEPGAVVTFFAVWLGNQYTVYFNPDDGQVSPTFEKVTFGTAYGTLPAPTKYGCTFNGWYTAKNGGGVNISSSTTVAVTSSQTLYAKWIVNEGYYTITFNANGGYGGTVVVMHPGDALSAPTVSRANYVLQGWSPSVPATAPEANTTYTAIWSDYNYTVSNSQVTITQYHGAGGNVIIPSTLGGYPVTGITGYQQGTNTLGAFYGCTVPTVVTIPDTVKVIGDSAFENCTKVTGVNIPASVTTIDNFAFAGSGLTSFNIGSNISTIGRCAFSGCDNLTEFTVDNGNGYFTTQNGVLFNKTKTTLIQYPGGLAGGYVFPDGVTTIGDLAFNMCEKLTNIAIPDSVTAIGDTAFAGCNGLTSLTFGSGLITAGPYAFSDCDKLTRVTIPGSIATLGNCMFVYCDNLTSVTIGRGITKVGESMFDGCKKLTSVSIPDTVKTIDSAAFQSCESLTSIILPSSITNINSGAFYNDTVLTSAYFYGAPPAMGTDVFKYCASGFTIYHLPDKTGFTSPTWYGYPTAVFSSVSTITFDANGGTGGTSTSMTCSATLTPPTVTKPGYVFAGWSPVVPATVPAGDTTYTAQYYPLPTVRVTKLADGFKVTLKDWDAAYKYQIWSYQKITSDLFSGGTASQWVLSKAYTSPASSDVIHETDGSISFIIGSFTSPDKNYTVSVRIMDGSGAYVDEVSDSYTPEDVQEVKITKVLVDDKYSEGTEVKEIGTTPISFMVIGNNVPGTVYTAKIAETGTKLTAGNTYEFDWDTSPCTPGTYTVQFTASNGATTDTKTVTIQLYSLDTGIVYGSINDLGLSAPENTALPKTVAINPSFTNGSFYYRISEPGRQPIFTSGLFSSTDTIEHTFTKYGIYYIQGFVNRQYEVNIGNNYDDGYFKMLTVSRSLTEPSTETLAANVNIDNPVEKGAPVTFTASASIGNIGSTPVQYSFWRYDAGGYMLVKDWSSDNTLTWTPARVGNYVIEARAKGTDAGSYEVKTSKTVNVTDTADEIAQGVVITLNNAEINANAQARVPITIKAAATSTNSEDLLYKFNVSDSAMGTTTLQNYSANQEFIWTPRKAGTYTISVLVKNTASFGAYDALQSFEVTVR